MGDVWFLIVRAREDLLHPQTYRPSCGTAVQDESFTCRQYPCDEIVPLTSIDLSSQIPPLGQRRRRSGGDVARRESTNIIQTRMTSTTGVSSFNNSKEDFIWFIKKATSNRKSETHTELYLALLKMFVEVPPTCLSPFLLTKQHPTERPPITTR